MKSSLLLISLFVGILTGGSAFADQKEQGNEKWIMVFIAGGQLDRKAVATGILRMPMPSWMRFPDCLLVNRTGSNPKARVWFKT